MGIEIDFDEIEKVMEQDIEKIIRQVIENLSFSSKQRINSLLRKVKENGEIIDFLRCRCNKLKADFIITLVKGDRHAVMFLKGVESQTEADKYKVEQEELEGIIAQDKFVKIEVLIAGRTMTDEKIESSWQKILKKFKKS